MTILRILAGNFDFKQALKPKLLMKVRTAEKK